MRKRISIIGFLAFAALLALLPPGGFSAWTWESGLRWLYFFMLSFFAVLAFTPFSFTVAKKIGAIDKPDDRKIHYKDVPRLGGLAIWSAFLFAFLRNADFSIMLSAMVTASTLIFLVGAADDSRNLSAYTRLFFQFLASTIVFFCGFKITFFKGLGLYGEILSYICTTLWLVGILNAFNFMDGIDGLASSMGLICSLCFTVLGALTGQAKLAIISAAICGACAGFLVYNWNPAVVFLGDSGSTLIGFSLGSIAIYTTWGEHGPLPALAGPLLVLGIPIFDLIYTTISRIKRGKISNLSQWLQYTGKDHLHHRLMNIGFDAPKAVVFIVLLNVILGLGAIGISLDDKSVKTYTNLIQGTLVFMLIVFIMVVASGREKKEGKET